MEKDVHESTLISLSSVLSSPFVFSAGNLFLEENTIIEPLNLTNTRTKTKTMITAADLAIIRNKVGLPRELHNYKLRRESTGGFEQINTSPRINSF